MMKFSQKENFEILSNAPLMNFCQDEKDLSAIWDWEKKYSQLCHLNKQVMSILSNEGIKKIILFFLLKEIFIFFLS